MLLLEPYRTVQASHPLCKTLSRPVSNACPSICDFKHCTFSILLPIPFTHKLVQAFILKHILLQHKRANQIQIQEETILRSKSGASAKPVFYLIPYNVSLPVEYKLKGADRVK